MNKANAAPGDIVEALDAIVDRTVEALRADPVYGRLCDGTASREVYLLFLERTYQYVKHTQRQLQLGGSALAERNDPLYRALRENFEHHAREETGHDQWLLDDIAAIGGDPKAAARAEPALSIKIYIATAEIVLASKHPLGILGTGYVLEGVAERLGTPAAEAFKQRGHISNIANALSFLSSHGAADIEHMAEARATIRQIENEDDRAAILLAAELAATQYRYLLKM